MQYIFLSHDVDWRKQGPTKKHIMDRRDRFDEDVIKNLNTKNPYYNFSELMNIENDLNVKSTFFFRTIYENGDYTDYKNEILDLIKGNWEIGLHLDPESTSDFKKIQDEKIKLEKITKKKIFGNRVHYLKHDIDMTKKLQKLGFLYDSSIRYSKDKIDEKEMGFSKNNGIYEFPITFMDAYLFTYMKISEEKLISIFDETLKYSRNLGTNNILTLNWHDNVLQMKGGRMYKKILEFLVSQNDVEINQGIDLVQKINNGELV